MTVQRHSPGAGRRAALGLGLALWLALPAAILAGDSPLPRRSAAPRRTSSTSAVDRTEADYLDALPPPGPPPYLGDGGSGGGPGGGSGSGSDGGGSGGGPGGGSNGGSGGARGRARVAPRVGVSHPGAGFRGVNPPRLTPRPHHDHDHDRHIHHPNGHPRQPNFRRPHHTHRRR